MHDPVCPLILALYGHPDSGGHWEQHCTTLLTSIGFKELRPWRSCFWHAELKHFLVVYVDDFTLRTGRELEERMGAIVQNIDAETAHGQY